MVYRYTKEKGELKLNHILSIILFALCIVFLLIQYFKSKKVYMLFAIIPILLAILLQTPLAVSINKTLSNSLIGIIILALIYIFNLSLKDDKEQK